MKFWKFQIFFDNGTIIKFPKLTLKEIDRISALMAGVFTSTGIPKESQRRPHVPILKVHRSKNRIKPRRIFRRMD